MKEKHVSVLLGETINNLNIKEDGNYVDATLGFGGHSSLLLKRVKRGSLFAFDQDLDAIEYSQERLSKIGHNFKLIHSNFTNLNDELNKENIKEIDGIIFDLGVSSPQIDDAKRGFSFGQDAPLDMRMDRRNTLDAKKVINEYAYEELVHIFFGYGEEKQAKIIAKKIIDARNIKEIETTKEFVSIIERAVGANYFYKTHPERKIFQAIRIEVNKELEILEDAISDAIDLLKPGGRICVISFHSLEDRIVKNIFKKYSEVPEIVKGLPVIPKEYRPKIKLITKKPITPDDKELEENPRSKSSKLRVAERL